MSDIQLPIEFMKVGFVIAVPLLALYFVLLFVKNQLVKCVIYICKMFAYAALAWIMWSFYKNRETIDIISAFTFIFCCFESIDNFISFISIPIENIRDIVELKNRM